MKYSVYSLMWTGQCEGSYEVETTSSPLQSPSFLSLSLSLATLTLQKRHSHFLYRHTLKQLHTEHAFKQLHFVNKECYAIKLCASVIVHCWCSGRCEGHYAVSFPVCLCQRKSQGSQRGKLSQLSLIEVSPLLLLHSNAPEKASLSGAGWWMKRGFQEHWNGPIIHWGHSPNSVWTNKGRHPPPDPQFF